MNRSRKTLLALLLCAGLIAATCAAPPTATPVPEAPPPTEAPTDATDADQAPAPPPEAVAEAGGGTIVMALAEVPTTLDPADHRSRESETVIRNLYDGLVTRDTRSEVYPELAEELTWRDDQTLEIALRQGVRFHDGSEMTADDVVRTFERLITEDAIEYPEPHTSPRLGLIAPLERIVKTGDYAVVMHFSDSWPPALQMLVHQQMVSAAYLDAVGTAGLVANPMGSGPFRFVSASPGLEQVVMERFPDYYGAPPGCRRWAPPASIG